MLASINPLVERGRHSRYWVTATAYVVGSFAGGAAMGLLAGALGSTVRLAVDLDRALLAWVVVVLCACALACELGRVRVPSLHRQVDEIWLEEYRGWVYGLGFGFQLGLGLGTIVTSASVYLVFVIAALSGSLASGLVIGITFGFVRALPLLTMARVQHPAQLRTHLSRFTAWAPRASAATAVVVGLTAVVALASLAVGGAHG